MSERYETEDIVDNGAVVRTDITRVANTSGRPERVYTQEEIQQAWQDGHDTALINGQSQNPHDQEPR